MSPFIDRVKAADARGEFGPHLASVYVYEAPVRLWHWVNALAVVTLIVTGYLIGSPFPSLGGEASAHFLMGYVRFTHFAAGQIMAVAFIARALWALVGNRHSRQLFYWPIWSPAAWSGAINELAWYLFIIERPRKYIGHNPLAHASMFGIFTLGTLFMICTGGALYSEGEGRDSWQAKLFGWVFSIWPNSQQVHTYHHIGMWVMVLFIMAHIYAAIREEVMSRQTMLSAMMSGERFFRDDDDE
jgi:Ni/Fe-hydrogenase 1 B-type cytochrome subunit